MTSDREIWTGFLEKDGENVRSVLFDKWGWKVYLTGKPAVKDGKNGYELTGILGETPPDFWVRILDEEQL